MDVPQCPGCRARDAQIAELKRANAELTQRVAALEARVGTNSTNSSVPPAANPLDAPKPVVKKPTGRKPGGQPGHPPRLKTLLPAERVNKVVPLVPSVCEHCQANLPKEAGPSDPPPTRHQTAELPKLQAIITEYQGHSRTCLDCGHITHQAIPQEIRNQSFGDRLTATTVYLTGRHRLSKRAAEELIEDVFEVPISLGAICGLEQEVSQALEPIHAEVVQAVQQAEVKNVDETSWKKAGVKCWLWLAATPYLAAFVIHPRRSVWGFATLLGNKIYGILCSDRWSVYDIWPVLQRQVCWAHLKRDFQKCLDRGGPSEEVGRGGLRIVKRVFKAWHLFRGGGLTRQQLQLRLSPVARDLKKLLDAGRSCADKKTASFCQNLLDLEPALWRFVADEGVEPTNNHAERLLRHAVIWRKTSFGCHSAAGCRFVERMLTATQSLRLQQRNVLEFLVETVHAHRTSLPAPSLLPKIG